MRAKIHVVAPTRVTPIALPLSSATVRMSGATLSVKWLPSVCVAIALIGEPASRKTRMSVLPVMPTRISPAMTALRRSEEHTSELQSRLHLVCRLLLEKKKKKHQTTDIQVYGY